MGYLGHLALILAVDETSFPGGQHRALLGKLALALTRKMEHGPCGLRQPTGVGWSSELAQLVAGAYLSNVATDDPAGGVRELRSIGQAPYPIESFQVVSFVEAWENEDRE